MFRYERLVWRGVALGSTLIALGAGVILPGTSAAVDVPPRPAMRPPVELATLSWPPYTKRALPKGGAVTAVVRAAFNAAGREVRVRYRPWNRAIALAKADGNRVVGYYPGYHCNHHPDSGFLRSYIIGMRPLGLAKRANAAFSWNSLADLEGFRIGTVVGYANTRTFDRKVAAGELWTIESHSDRQNLYKLIKGRLDYAVIDKHVMTYLLRHVPALRPHRDEVVMDDTLLGRMPLFVCFRNTPRGEVLRSVFNDGLARVPEKRMMARHIARLTRTNQK